MAGGVHSGENPRFSPQRLVLAGVVGLAVTGLALASALQAATGSTVMRYRQGRTRFQLQLAERDVRTYRDRFGKLPRSLDQLGRLPEPRVRLDRDGQVRDGWDRPLGYAIQRDGYLLFSYGRDGRPGGNSLDADLTHRNLRPPEARLAYRELFSLRETRGMVFTCFLGGLCAAMLAWWVTSPEDINWHALPVLGIKLLLTGGAALFVAMVLTVLHVPTGH